MEKYESQKALFTKKLEDVSLTEQKRKSYELKLQIALDGIRDLKPRMYAFTDLRGVEEQFAAPREAEDSDIRDESETTSHL